MGSANLAHIIYASSCVSGLPPDELRAILDCARRNNERDQITGLLVFSGGTFFQVLEGEEDAIGACFERIRRDPRHLQVVTIIDEPLATRVFADWSMGFADLGGKEFCEAAGLEAFDLQDGLIERLRGGRARKLLGAFAQGRWRRRIGEGP